jgi:predicted small lipoprotein YifL
MSVLHVLRRGIFALPFAAVIAACGSRGPLDIGPSNDMDAGIEADIPEVSVPDTNPSPPDAGRDSGPNPVNCGVCVVQNCGQPVLKCLQDMKCRAVLTCVTQTCLAGGKLDPACLIGCGNGDPSAAIEAFQIIQCLTGKCGGDCGGVLPGLGGN